MWTRSANVARLHTTRGLLRSSLVAGPSYSTTRIVNVSSFLNQPCKLALVGAPMELGQPKKGTNDGPSVLRSFNLKKTIEKQGWVVDDKGDVPMDEKSITLKSTSSFEGLAHNCEYVGIGNERVMNAVKQAAEEKSFVLTVGGDHSIGAGTVAGMLSVYPNLGVLWVDAHADINTPLTSGSGNMHGTSLIYRETMIFVLIS